MEEMQKKITNKDLYEKQLETLRLFYERKLLTKEQYDYELQILTTKMKLNDWKNSFLLIMEQRNFQHFSIYKM